MNCEAVVQYLVDWLRDKVNKAGGKGVVLGISGGIDSAVAAVLAKQAFPDNCLGLIMPCESSLNDLIHSKILVEKFNIDYKIIELDNAYHILSTEFDAHFGRERANVKQAKANIKPRLRMTTLYYAAQTYNYLVLGTSNRSELTVGYSTKYGDSGVDLQILGDLVKREVYELARYLKVPDEIINKPPSAGLWEGQTDEKEMGISYAELDRYIETGEGRPEVIAVIETLHRKNEHKLRLPPIPVIPAEMR